MNIEELKDNIKYLFRLFKNQNYYLTHSDKLFNRLDHKGFITNRNGNLYYLICYLLSLKFYNDHFRLSKKIVNKITKHFNLSSRNIIIEYEFEVFRLLDWNCV